MEEDGRPGSALVRILALVPALRLLFLRVRGVLLGVLAAFPAVRLVLRGLFGGLSGAGNRTETDRNRGSDSLQEAI